MIDAIIIFTFILAGAGTGFHGIDFLPPDTIANLNIQNLRWVTLGVGSVVGLVAGLIVQNTYRRVETNIRSPNTESTGVR